MPLITKRSQLATEPCTVTGLQVSCTKIFNLRFLVNYPYLTKLILHGLQLTDLNGLQYAPRLTTLCLWGLHQLTDLNGLQYTPRLTTLYLQGLHKLTDLEGLQYTPRLVTLDLWELHQLTDLNDLQYTPHLITLDLCELPRLIGLGGLQYTPQLTELKLIDLPRCVNTELPRLPMLEALSVDRLTTSNGLAIPVDDSLTHYQRAWSRAKRA